MRSIFRTWLFLLLIFALQACVEKDRLERRVILQAEQLMQEQPDSALHLLQTIPRQSLSGKTLARYALIHSIAQDKSGLNVTSDSLLRVAYDYYCRHPEDSLYARSQYYMGKYLWLTEQPDSSYNCLLRAKTVSEADKDYYTAYLATDRMRRIAEISDTTLCLNLSKEAYQLYLKQGADNPVNEAFLLIGIGESYSRRGDRDSTLYYYDLALNKAQLAGDSIAIASVLQNISRYYNHYHENRISLDYAQRALSYRGYLDKWLATLLARCYIENAEYDKARQYINALPPTDSKENQLVKLGLQHRLSAKTGDADAAQEYFNAACNVAADMYLSTQKDKLELHRKNLHEALERQRAEHQRTVLYICLGFSIALLTLLSLLLSTYRKKVRSQVTENQLLEKLHLAEKERLLAEEARHLLQEEYKERLLEETRSYVKKIIGFHQKLEESQASGNPLAIDDRDWSEIQAYLNACDNSFVTRFKEQYPTLSEEDFHLCLLLRYGLTNSDLERVYFISPQAIKTKQRLLKNKLSIGNKDVSLRQSIQGF